MRPTRSPACTPLAMRPAAMALTSVANSLALTGVQRPWIRRGKMTASGLVRARSVIASVRQASAGTSTTCGVEYSCTGRLLSDADGCSTYRGAPRGAGLLGGGPDSYPAGMTAEIPGTDRCPKCGAAVRYGDPWCTLCYADLRPPPPPEPAPLPDAPAPVPAIPPEALTPVVGPSSEQLAAGRPAGAPGEGPS